MRNISEWALAIAILIAPAAFVFETVSALVRAFRFGSVRTGVFVGSTVFRSIQPAKFWRVVAWRTGIVVWFALAFSTVFLGWPR
jgi:hypothetical protein